MLPVISLDNNTITTDHWFEEDFIDGYDGDDEADDGTDDEDCESSLFVEISLSEL